MTDTVQPAISANGGSPHPEVEAEKPPNFHICDDGLRVDLLPVNPMLLQKILKKVLMPPRPTYETKTISGKVEFWPMDEEAAEQTEGGKGLWLQYLEERDEALSKQQDITTEAIMLFGTKCEIVEDGWDVKQELFDIEVPTQPDKRRAHYLMTTRSNDDLQAIMRKVMALTGIDEGKIAEAKDSFRDPVRGGQEESGHMDDHRSNRGNPSQEFSGQMAA